MTARHFVLGLASVAENLHKLIDEALPGTRVELKPPRRSVDQNARQWSMLTDFAEQVDHGGRKYDATQWKSILMHAYGQEIDFVPSLDGKTFVPIPHSTRVLSVKEMIDFQEFITVEGLQRGVAFTVYGHEKEAK
jgi:hypothetical protein